MNQSETKPEEEAIVRMSSRFGVTKEEFRDKL